MDQCTHEVRAEYWRSVITACSQRPAGQSAKSWMKENGIREQSYYLWQRKFRKQAYEQMKDSDVNLPAVSEKNEVAFVEIPCTSLPQMDKTVITEEPAAVIRTAFGIIEISNGISPDILGEIIARLSHA